MRIFVASSTAGLPEARAIQENLEAFAEVVIWNQQVFSVSSYTLESLEQASVDFDFGIFVMTPDDLRKSAGSRSFVPRDNVILEYGIFLGSLGRRRSFLVVPSSVPNMRLPTDLDGLVQARYRRDREDENLTAALAPACEKIQRAIEKLLTHSEPQVKDISPTLLSPEPEVQIRPHQNEAGSRLHHCGRLPPSYTGQFLQGARKEISIIGISLRSFIGYFESRPEAEVKKPVVDALTRGARVCMLFLDPESNAARQFAKERSDKRLIGEIRRTLDRACELRSELISKTRGAKLEIRTYQNCPSFQLKRVDSGTKSARILSYPYLPGLRRPETPYLEIRQAANPRLFLAYSRACDHLLRISKRIS